MGNPSFFLWPGLVILPREEKSTCVFFGESGCGLGEYFFNGTSIIGEEVTTIIREMEARVAFFLSFHSSKSFFFFSVSSYLST